MSEQEEIKQGNQFIGWVTVSSKGQIAIPKEIRGKLGIKNGHRLLVILRKDNDGFNLIKSEALHEVFERFSK